PLSDLVHAFTSPPNSTCLLKVPPSFRKPVKPPLLSVGAQPSHEGFADPYPNPNPIQNPSRVCGCCAAAQRGPATARTPRIPRKRVTARIRPPIGGKVAPRWKSTRKRQWIALAGSSCARPITLRNGHAALHEMPLGSDGTQRAVSNI